MKKKKHRGAILAGCAVLVAALSVLLVILKNRESRPDQQELFLTFTADKIAAVTYTTAEGEAVSFRREDGRWEAEDSGLNVDQMKAGALASSLTGVRLLDVITEPASFSEYGLAEGVHTLLVTDTDGNRWNIETGGVNDTAGVVYCTLNGDGKVYCVSNVLLLRLDDPYEAYEAEDESSISAAEDPVDSPAENLME